MPKLRSELLEQYIPVARREVVKAARAHDFIEYGQVINRVGAGRGYIGQVLDELNRREYAKGRPLLSSIVVHRGSRNPGDGFWSLPMLPPFTSESARRAFLKAEQERVWAFDWPDG